MKKPVKKIKKAKQNALIIVKKEDAVVPVEGKKMLSLMEVDDIMGFAKSLKGYIVANNLSVTIEGHEYAKVDAWKFAGISFGLTGIPSAPVPMHMDGQVLAMLIAPCEYTGRNGKPYTKDTAVFIGFTDNHEQIEYVKMGTQKIIRELYRPYYSYKCGCDVVKISDGTRVSFGEGMCSNMEEGKVLNAEYSINSMAQTRAIGKALRNLLGFVMSSAGYEPTPAEEMDEVKKAKEDFKESEAPKLSPLSKNHESGTLEKARNGEWSVDYIIEHCSLNDVQLKALRLAEGKAKELKIGIWA